MRAASWNQAQVTDASVVLVLCADLHAWKKDPAKIINLPQDHIIVMMVVVGKALKAANPRGGQLALDEVTVNDHF